MNMTVEALEKQRARCRKSYHKHREERLKRMANWYAGNKSKKTAYNKDFYAANKEGYRQRFEKYYAENREALIAKSSLHVEIRKKRTRHSLRIIQANPWMRSEICTLYKEARRLTKETGVEHHVDHIVPLVNELVCGLHVPANLEVITGAKNRAKGNRFWPDMPS